MISSSLKDSKIAFLTPEDEKLLQDFRTKSFEVQVGLHELLGHGSGKLFKIDDKGQYNFDIANVVNPLNGQKVYKKIS